MTWLTRSSLKNRLIVGLTTLAVAVLGLFSMSALKQELMPPMQMPMAWVTVQSQGLAPEEMADAVTEPVEQALSAVPGVTKVHSSTSTGSADISVEWEFGEDDDAKVQALRAATDAVKPGLPQGTEVQLFTGGMDSMPALMLTAAAQNGDSEALGVALAQRVVPALQGIAGVSRVTLSGLETENVLIELRPADVERLKVDPALIAAVLQAHSGAVPAGQADSADGRISISVGDPLGELEQIAQLPIATENGVVRVGDFADVRLESEPSGAISRVNGKPALTLDVYPASGANVVDISHAVNAELDRQAEGLKAEFVTLFDQAPYIEQSIHDLSVEGGLGLLFAVIVILAFLRSWRSTLIAALSIPLSLLITLLGLWWSGNTLNILTLGALTIAIGRVVDDSIVVIENISRRRGDGPLTIDGVVASVRQVAGAITASTLTTVAVFLPIAFVSGIAGQLFGPFAITVTIALLASLLVALTIVPVFAFWLMKHPKRVRVDRAEDESDLTDVLAVASEEPAERAGDPPTVPLEAPAAVAPRPIDHESDLAEIHSDEDRLQRALMPALRSTRRHPVITVAVSILILVSTLAMSLMLRTDLLGSSGAETLSLTQTLPKLAADDADAAGSSGADGAENAEGAAAAESTEAPEPSEGERLLAAAETVEKALLEVDGVRDIMTTIPVDTAGGETTVSYSLMLEKGVDAIEVERAVDSRLERVRGAGEFELLTQDSFAVGGGGIALQIRGNDPVALRKASEMLEQRLEDADGVRSVKSELSGEQPVMRVELNEPRATELGFDRMTVAQAIDEALRGKVVGSIMLSGEDRSIVLRTPGTSRTAESLGELLMPVTQQQTAAAQKKAFDELEAQAKQQAEEQRMEASAELSRQLDEAYSQRSQLSDQLAALQQQLAALQRAPIVPDTPLTPDEDALRRAQQERAEQLAALQGAIEGARGGIESLDQQTAMLREQQGLASQALAEQQQAEAEQKAAGEVRGTAVRLDQIATVEQQLTAPTIVRSDGERQVVLTVTPVDGELDLANAAVQTAIAETELPAGVSFELGGVSAEQDEAFAQLGFAMLAAIMLVMLVMVATFRSFRGPLVLLVSVPFAATGAILALLLTNTALGLPALIGLLMLIGIVVTNAIVLMDLMNRLRDSGATLDEAVEHGTRLRLRPILMTAAATIFALVPMSLGLTGGGVFISQPLAIVVIGGLFSSTLLTLVLVPVLYTLVERRRERKLARRAERRLARAETEFEVVSEQ